MTVRSFILPVLLIGMFFIPFNSWSGIEELGEYHRDSCFIFFAVASALVLAKKRIKIPIENLIFQILVLFIIWALLATVINSQNILSYYFKHTSGIARFINQYGSLIIAAIIIPLTFYNGFINYDFKKLLFLIRKVILWSLIVVTLYASIEIMIVKFDMLYLKKPILNLFDYFPFTEARIDTRTKRISSVSFESPALATYLISIFGWMFSYIFTEFKKTRYIPVLVVLFLAFMSGSRSAFFIIIVQLIFAIWLSSSRKKLGKAFLSTGLFAILTTFILIIYFNKPITTYVKNEINSFRLDDSSHALSNKSRFGIQQAMLNVFFENPISGTGYGLQAFEAWKKYPAWAKKDNWEFRLRYLNPNYKPFPPGYNLYVRILSETGIIGFLIFVTFLTQILLSTFKNLNKNRILNFIVLVSMAGFYLNWLKTDSFRIYFFWICISLIFLTNQNKPVNEK